MEDFGFKMQNITKGEFQPRTIAKVVLLIVAFVLLIIISIQLVKGFYTEINVNNVPLIKAQAKKIKELPEDTGGLVVDNLNINVYDVIDNNNKDTNPIINKTKQNIDMANNLSNDILSDQELLANKIDEIQNDVELTTQSTQNIVEADDTILENINTNTQNITAQNESLNIKTKNSSSNMTQNVSNVNEVVATNQVKDNNEPNIKINANSNKLKTNVNDLKKLGNDALIANLKNHKDIKPGIRVQLLALKSRNGIVDYWNELVNKYNTLFKDKNYYIESADLENMGTIYRLQVGMFDSEDSARYFCQEYIKLTNKNKIDCIIINN